MKLKPIDLLCVLCGKHDLTTEDTAENKSRRCLNDFQLISPRITHIKSSRARNRSRIRNYLDAGIAELLFGFSQIIDGKTYVARTDRSRFFINRKMQLIQANLIPGSALTR